MKGDRLASGAASATFAVAPGFKFDEAEMRKDLDRLPAQAFMEKYLIAQREYDLLINGTGEAVNDFAEKMKRQAEFYERGLASDKQQAASLKRACIITPFVPWGLTGKVVVNRDEPATPEGERGRLLIPRKLRTEKTLLPTTGHVIRSCVYDTLSGQRILDWELNRRILFGQMSGTPVCMSGYPTWTVLELPEIIAFIDVEDAEVEEEKTKPLV